MDTNRVNGLNCIALPGFARIFAKRDLEFRLPQGEYEFESRPGHYSKLAKVLASGPPSQ